MKRKISVVGSATTSVAPDIARTNCGVQVIGPNAHDVLRRSNEAMQAMIEAASGSDADRPDDRHRAGRCRWRGRR